MPYTIEHIIGSKIKRIKVPGYEVGSRDTIIDNLANTKRPSRSNKAKQISNIHKKADKNKKKK